MQYFFRAILVLGLAGAFGAGYHYVMDGVVTVFDLSIGLVAFFAVEVLAKLYQLIDEVRSCKED